MDRGALLATAHESQRVRHDWATNTFILSLLEGSYYYLIPLRKNVFVYKYTDII